MAGQLGCPVCGRTFTLDAGVLDTGDAPAFEESRFTALDPSAAARAGA